MLLDTLERHWKKLLLFLGVPALADMVREYFRHRLMDSVVTKLGPFGIWLSKNPSALFTLSVIVVLVWFIVVLARQVSPNADAIILDQSGRPVSARPSRRFVVASSLVLLAIVVAIGYGWRSYYLASRVPRQPAPPSGLQVAVHTELPFRFNEGKIVVFSKRELPCSYGKASGHGLEGLQDLPGGPQLRRPSFVILARNFVTEEWQSEGKVDLLFYTELTNRGEASIAKDWSLCLVQDNKPTYYAPGSIDSGYLGFIPPGHSLAENTSRVPVEHGRMAEGWLLFRLPKGAIDVQSFSGSLACRDYLDHREFMTFSTEN